MINYLLLVKTKENLFEVENLLQGIFESDDILSGEETQMKERFSNVVEQLEMMGEDLVVNKLLRKN